MPKTKQQKHAIVDVIAEKLSRVNSLIFADYQGMTMSQLAEIRNQLAENSAEFSVTKNNLLKIALKRSQNQIDDKVLEGPVATLFAFGDEITPIKILSKAIKELNIGKIKGGILDGEFLDESKINKLALLPSKDELRGQVVGTLGSPLYGIVGVLQASLRNLVYALDQIRKQKGGE